MLNTDIFIARSKLIHKDKYNYDKVEYFKNHIKVIITCPMHGDFMQLPHNHMNGKGCKKCADENNNFKRNAMNKNVNKFNLQDSE